MSAIILTHPQIIERYATERGIRPIDLISLWDSGLGDLAHSRQAHWNWLKVNARIGPRTLRLAMHIYSPDTWQYQLAAELLAAAKVDPVGELC